LRESNDESLGFARLQFAYGSLKRTSYFKILGKIWRLSLKRFQVRLVSAYGSLERTGEFPILGRESVARLSERLTRLSERSSGQISTTIS